MADDTAQPDSSAAEQVEVNSHDRRVMSVKVYAPFQVYFEGEAKSVSAVNGTGPFDVLPRHHNFLCMLVPCDLTIQPVEGDKKTIKINRALMHVKANRVVVFVDV